MSRYPTLVDMLGARAEQAPTERGVLFLEERDGVQSERSFAELDQRARAIAAQLQASHAPGERALLLYPPGIDFITAFFGCLYAGVVAIPVMPPIGRRSFARLAGIAGDAAATVCMTTAEGAAMGRATGTSVFPPGVRWVATPTIEDERAADYRRPSALDDPDTLAFVQYTSGSTRAPRGVMLSHANLLDNLERIATAFDIFDEALEGFNWLPPYHDMGLIGAILMPFYVGHPALLMSPLSFVQRPMRWLEAISRLDVAVSGGPNFAYALCCDRVDPAVLERLDLSRWRVAFCGAEPISASVLERFATTFAPAGFRPEAFLTCYGLAEATLFVTGCHHARPPHELHVDPGALERGRIEPTADPPSSRTLVGCGTTVGDTRVVIVDPETARPCADDRIGEIWVASPSVARGYFGDHDGTAAVFSAHLEDGQGPFLRTGDLGALHDGELYVVGRRKDLLIVDGRNIHPQDVEATVEQAHPTGRAGATAVFAIEAGEREELVVVCELGDTPGEHLADSVIAIRGAVAAEHGITLDRVVFIKDRGLPKTSSGKVARWQGREELRSGRLPIVAAWGPRGMQAPVSSGR